MTDQLVAEQISEAVAEPDQLIIVRCATAVQAERINGMLYQLADDVDLRSRTFIRYTNGSRVMFMTPKGDPRHEMGLTATLVIDATETREDARDS